MLPFKYIKKEILLKNNNNNNNNKYRQKGNKRGNFRAKGKVVIARGG